jgi:parallel beta-helix repeat protein
MGQLFINTLLLMMMFFGGCSQEDMQFDNNMLSKSRSLEDSGAKIFIIGDSTVHNHDYPLKSGEYLELGWGDQLQKYMVEPDNLFNEARSGSSSKSYKISYPKRHDWQETKELISSANLNDGAYLFIQFGHNDVGTKEGVHTKAGRYNSFYNNLKEYIDEARALGVTPVLITPVQRQHKGNHHIPQYVDTIKILAKDEQVLLLDLSKKSFDEFNKYNSTEEIHQKFGYDDHTHFNPEGAKIVASWVKELACNSLDRELCKLFKSKKESTEIDDGQFHLVYSGDFTGYKHFAFFIDADNDPNTGYSRDKIKGADFLVQKNGLYHYPTGAKGWKWERVDKKMSVTNTNSVMKSTIPSSLLYNSEKIVYYPQASTSDWKKSKIYAPQKAHISNQKVKDTAVIGKRVVTSTSLQKATHFAAVDGSGSRCTNKEPCSIETAFSTIKAGDVLFLRGGVYKLDRTLRLQHSGEKNRPIVIESYPDEWAVLDGGRTTPQSVASSWNNKLNGIKLDSKKEYIHIRKLEVKNMGGSGIAVQGSYSIVEGCKVHHNFSAGVAIYGGEWHEDRPNYVIPYKRGYNIIRDNEIYANSDVGLHGSSGDGGNADGIWVGSGKFNKIEHNRVYKNSDDGIDTWRSNDTYVAYNIVFENGLAEGDGNGIKAGGNLNKDAKNGRRAIVEHNIVYNNRAVGVDYNAGRFDIFRYNTAYHIGSF